MTLYVIEAPYMSKNFKRSFNKKLEVFCGEIENTSSRRPQLKAHTLFEYKKGKWVQKTTSKTFEIHPHTIFDSLDFRRLSGEIAFKSLELAQIAKIKLVDTMMVEFEDEIQKIRDSFERNVPKTKQPMAEMKDKFPELFL
jgi:hypothetical protein